MSRDLEARLFRAARLEKPSEAARQRALAAMLAEPEVEPGASSGVRGVVTPERPVRHGVIVTVVAVSAAAALVFAVLHARREDASISATPEPPRASSAAETSAEPSSTASPPPAPSTARPAPPPAPPRSSQEAPQPPPSLSDEVHALDAARQELAGGNATEALRLLDRYDALHGRRLADEATLLRIEALVRGGKQDAARRLAERFVDGNPNSPLADRARVLVSGAPKSVPTNGEKP